MESILTTILSSIGLIVTSAVSWCTSYLTLITGQPLLLMFVVLSFVGLGIGILRRLMNVN